MNIEPSDDELRYIWRALNRNPDEFDDEAKEAMRLMWEHAAMNALRLQLHRCIAMEVHRMTTPPPSLVSDGRWRD